MLNFRLASCTCATGFASVQGSFQLLAFMALLWMPSLAIAQQPQPSYFDPPGQTARLTGAEESSVEEATSPAAAFGATTEVQASAAAPRNDVSQATFEAP